MENKVEIDGMNFTIQFFPARKGAALDSTTLKILSPLVDMFKGATGLDSDIDFGNVAGAIKEILINLDGNMMDDYITRMVEYTIVDFNADGAGARPVSLNKADIFDAVFAGKISTIYKLLLQIMKVNNFSFFGLLGGGGFNITGILQKVQGKEKN